MDEVVIAELSTRPSKTFQRLLAGLLLLLTGFVAGLLVGARSDDGGTPTPEVAVPAPEQESVPAPEQEAVPAPLLPRWTPGDASEGADIVVGALVSCVLWADGNLRCWGSPPLDRITPPEGTRLQQLSVGDAHGCGIDEDGDTVCWGSSIDGRPMAAPDERFLLIRASPSGPGQPVQQCGLLPDRIVCWTPDWDGATVSRTLEGSFSDFAISGEQHLCAIEEDGALICVGGLFPLDPPVDVSMVSVSLGWFFGCAITDGGALHCFGTLPDAPDFAGLTAGVPDGNDFVRVAVGELDACAIRRDGSSVCWGRNGLTPPADVSLSAIAVGAGHACALTEAGTPVCWGQDHMGQASVPQFR